MLLIMYLFTYSYIYISRSFCGKDAKTISLPYARSIVAAGEEHPNMLTKGQATPQQVQGWCRTKVAQTHSDEDVIGNGDIIDSPVSSTSI